MKVISGGQTGVDQLALEIAKSVGIETGGCAPHHYMTVDGPAPELGTKYGLEEMVSIKPLASAYKFRTMRNVDDADGTLVVRLKSSPGTDMSLRYSLHGKWQSKLSLNPRKPFPYRPTVVITKKHLTHKRIHETARDIIRFIQINNIQTLNVAGHRKFDSQSDLESIRSCLTECFSVFASK